MPNKGHLLYFRGHALSNKGHVQSNEVHVLPKYCWSLHYKFQDLFCKIQVPNSMS